MESKNNSRDNFTYKTKRILAQRVGYLCSNPLCQKVTVGPNSDKNKSTNIGVAAHITAASENGPRYNHKLSNDERKDISNGIWLCYNCSVLVDKDENNYSEELLLTWKNKAEKYISRIIAEGSSLKTDTLKIPVNSKIKYIRGLNNFSLSRNGELIFSHRGYQLCLNYYPSVFEWDSQIGYLDYGNPYHSILQGLPKVIDQQRIKIKELEKITKDEGIDKICEVIFNQLNEGKGIPKLKYFNLAINSYFKEEITKDYIELIENSVLVSHRNDEYIITVENSLVDDLRALCFINCIDEFYTVTNECFWGHIYIDVGIERSRFIPKLVAKIEDFWDGKYKEPNRLESSLDKQKDKMWRLFKMFSDDYNSIENIIEFAYNLGDMYFYSLVVFTMLDVLNKDICLNEYAELEFGTKRWNSIELEDEDLPIFYIKNSED